MISNVKVSLDLEIGSFHSVVGIDLADRYLRLHTNQGHTYYLEVVPEYSLEKSQYETIEFEPIGEAVETNGAIFNPMYLRGVTKIRFGELKTGSDYAYRDMLVETSYGVTFTFKIFQPLPVSLAA